MRHWHRVLLILSILGSTIFAAARDMALIANKSIHVESVAVADLIKICKGQSQHWPDGTAVTLIIRDPATPEMRLVLEKVYALPKDEVAALIANANHSRVDHPAIIVVDSDEALVKKVESTPGAVGLVDVYSITGGVAVVRIAEKLPLQPGYLLHGN